MGGGFGRGLILRGLCGPLVGFCLRLVIGCLPHGLAGVIDGVGRVVRGLLGGGDLVGRAGRILCGLLLGLIGVVVVRLRLLLVVCGCLLLGGGGVEVLLGGVQCGCGGVGLGLCFGHAGRGCLCDGLVGFGGALLCLLDAVLGLCDCLIGLVAGGCGFVGHCDCRGRAGAARVAITAVVATVILVMPCVMGSFFFLVYVSSFSGLPRCREITCFCFTNI